ncbi:MAG: HYR domain-containing protein [Blastocatellia bacterium]
MSKSPTRLAHLFALSIFALIICFALPKAIANNARARNSFTSASNRVSVHAAGRGNPYIRLNDGTDLQIEFSKLNRLADQDQADALALTSADFDEDGTPDLVTGYGNPVGGFITLLRGNVDSIYPNSPEARQRKAAGSFTNSAFLSSARSFELAKAADFVAAGDFDADGHWDIVAASRQETTLYFLHGNGHGSFGAAQPIELGGRVTAMAAGEVNRADGLTDVIVGINGTSGPKALVFESPEGALKGNPESFDLSAEATGIAVGNLDDEYTMDISIAAGSELVVIYGRDRKLSLDEQQQATVSKARTGRRSFPFGLKSVAMGDFKGDHKVGLSVLTSEGSVHLLTADAKKAKKKKKPSGIESWKDEVMARGNWQQATGLVRARLSSIPSDDLVVINPANHNLAIVVSSAAAKLKGANLQSVSLEAEGEPMAVLPMRLNADALSDLVVVMKKQATPAVMMTLAGAVANTSGDVSASGFSAQAVFGVTNTNDAGAGSLRQAITDANNTPGLDTITFTIGAGPQTITPLSALPATTDAVVIDGTTQPGFSGTPIIEINGSSAGNTNGFNIFAGNTTMRGLIINSFVADGVSIFNNGNSIVEGNFIGTDLTGSVALGNQNGVVVFDRMNNTIGGTTAAAFNLISGNNFVGVFLFGTSTTGNQVQGNFIGTNLSGTSALKNDSSGILIEHASNNVVGGTIAGARNLIAGNRQSGVAIQDCDSIGNLVQGNLIGTNVTGSASLTNSGGVLIAGGCGDNDGPTSNTIGGTTGAARNIISGDIIVGISIQGTDNLAQGNFIGTDLTGTLALANEVGAEAISTNNTIGGTTPGARNVISGNSSVGIVIFDMSGIDSTGSFVEGNFIGTDVSGTNALGNGTNGVQVIGSSNHIGGVTPSAGNLIAHNGGAGVLVSGQANSVLSNSIFSNGGLGIDRIGEGPTPNDPCDTDSGLNNIQNSPEMNLAFPSGNNRVTILGSLDSTPNTTFTIQFFANTDCDPSGLGEGETFIGSTQVTTNAACHADIMIIANAVPASQSITATATDPTGHTSEFSNCAPIVINPADVAITKTASTSTPKPGDKLTYTITVKNNGPTAASNVIVTDFLPNQLTFNSCSANSGGVCSGQGNARTVTFAQLASSTSATVTFETTVGASITSGTTVANTATVTTTSTDSIAANNTSTVNVIVSTNPIAINCPANVATNAAQGQSTAVVTFPLPTVAGNPVGVTLTCSPPSGSTFPMGATTVNCAASDAANNKGACEFTVTVAPFVLNNPAPDKVSIDFGNPVNLSDPNPPTDTFTLTNTGVAAVDVTLESIRRTGADVTAGKITNADDAGFFTIFTTNGNFPEIQIKPGSVVTIPVGQRSFQVRFNPIIPTVASRTSNLAANQVLPDVVASSVNFTTQDGRMLTINLVGRVSTGLHLIDPANTSSSPVVTFAKAGNQFTLTYSIYDSNQNVTRASYQFLNSSGQPVGEPLEVNLAGALLPLGLLRGQSFTVEQPFSGASSHPEIAGARVTVFDGESSVSADTNPSGAQSNSAGLQDSAQRLTLRLQRMKLKGLNP